MMALSPFKAINLKSSIFLALPKKSIIAGNHAPKKLPEGSF
jgi:hypothetical protein